MKDELKMNDKLKQKSKVDNAIMRVLKVSELSHRIAGTTRGELTLKLTFGQSERDYRFYLDAVPVDDVQNKNLLSLYFL